MTNLRTHWWFTASGLHQYCYSFTWISLSVIGQSFTWTVLVKVLRESVGHSFTRTVLVKVFSEPVGHSFTWTVLVKVLSEAVGHSFTWTVLVKVLSESDGHSFTWTVLVKVLRDSVGRGASTRSISEQTSSTGDPPKLPPERNPFSAPTYGQRTGRH